MRNLVPTPGRSDIVEAEQADYDALMGMFAGDGDRAEYPGTDVFGALLNAPSLAKAIMTVGMTILQTPGEKLPPMFHQFGDMVVSLELHRQRQGPEPGCELRVMYNHLPEALRNGVRPQAIRALLDDDETQLDDDETLCAAFARGVIHGRLAEETMAAMEARLGRRRTIEYGCLLLLVQYLTHAEDFVGCAAPTLDSVVARLSELVAAGASDGAT